MTKETHSNVLIVGATRGLGAELFKQYSSSPATDRVYGTSRSDKVPPASGENASYISSVDLLSPQCGAEIVSALPPASSHHLSTIIISSGIFIKDSLEDCDWDGEVKMYTISCVAPVKIVGELMKAGYLQKGSKVVLVGSESGSVTLRHDKEGGGLYGHHGSKSAVSMVGKLMSLDLREKEVSVVTVHPGFMMTEMTKSVGFDQFWEDGGAVTPEVAAKSLIDWVEKDMDMSKTGQFWAPRGPK